nr:hypothetical protein [Gemmatimonadaceae bacterium]
TKSIISGAEEIIRQRGAGEQWAIDKSEQASGNGYESEETSVVNVVSVVNRNTSSLHAKATFVVSVVREAPEDLEPEALYGLAGDVVRAIKPSTESHPAALLASFIAEVGCMMGRGPHVYRDGARHACNEFVNLVGLSGVSRKGTASRRVQEVTTAAGAQPPLCHGLGSGEALVAALVPDDEDNLFAERRLLVKEEEFSRALKVMRRDGSTLSENLRSAWDAGILASVTKGKKMEVRDAHVSLLGHITEAELRAELSAVSMFNGFANRFLWFCVRRVGSLPFGGGDVHSAPLVSRLHQTMEFSAKAGRMEFDDETRALWDREENGGGGIYDLLTARPPGLLGAVTSRAEAHVTRLSLMWALLDLEREIRVPHLMAALAVWDFCERSCAYLFGSSTGDEYADRIYELLVDAGSGYVTRQEIHGHFQRNAPAGKVDHALNLLERLGRAERTKLDATKGRAAEAWSANQFTINDRNDSNDGSPLARAREIIAKGTK